MNHPSLTDTGDGVVRELQNVQILSAVQAVDGRQFVVAQSKDSQAGHVGAVHVGDVILLR